MTSISHQRMPRSKMWSRLTLGLAACVAAFALSWRQGRGPLGTPPWTQLRAGELPRWYGQRTSIEVALGLIRVATLILAGAGIALFAVTLLSALLARTNQVSLQRLSLLCASLLPRRFLRWRDLAIGFSVSTALSLGPLAGVHAAPTQRTPADGAPRSTIAGAKRTPLASSPPTAGSRSHQSGVGDPTTGQQWPDISTRPAPSAAPTTSTSTSTSTSTTTSTNSTRTPTASSTTSPSIRRPAIAARATEVPLETQRTYIVRSGDSFWSIAEDIVGLDTPHASDAAIARYWRALIAENRALLPDPSNPDVLLVGTTIRLPKPT